MTTPTAARLAKFAGVQSGQRVLDVACGTGVVAITAARMGANVIGLDLTPELLERARENSGVAACAALCACWAAERIAGQLALSHAALKPALACIKNSRRFRSFDILNT